MTEIRIRRLTEQDNDIFWPVRIRALIDHANNFGMSAHDLAAMTPEEHRTRFLGRYLGGDNVVFGAWRGEDALVGMVGLVRNDGTKVRHRLEIWGVYVTPQQRGIGIASRLLDAAIRYAHELDGILQIHLTVASHNVAVIAAYRKQGFARWGVEPRSMLLDGRAIDEDHMVLMLDATAGRPVSQHPAIG